MPQYKLPFSIHLERKYNDINIDDFIKDFNIKDTDLKKGNIKIPNFRAHQLNALQNKYMNIEKNQDFNKL